MHTQTLEYADEGVELEAYIAWDPVIEGPRPGVLVSHAWGGRNDLACGRAEAIAHLGYVGFALDMYGRGVLGSSPEENGKLMQPFMDDRLMLRRRIGAALHALRSHDMVDPHRIGAIGYCFGGLCVLDLARSGAPVRGVASFHGLLQGSDVPNEAITAKILALHGYDDPFAPPESIDDFAAEMSAANADWQLHIYGNTQHAFTNPHANDPAMGTVYNKPADERSWQAMTNFLAEALGDE